MKTFLVKDASLVFDKSGNIIRLYHPAHGFFTVIDVTEKEGKTFVVFSYYGNLTYVLAAECTYNYPTAGIKQKPSNPFTQDRLDICYKILSVTVDMIKAASEQKDKDDIEFFAGWAAYEASQLSMYINHYLNDGEKK